MKRVFTTILSLAISACTAGVALGKEEIFDVWVETYKNSPLESLRISCSVTHPYPNSEILQSTELAATFLISCMSAPLKSTIYEAVSYSDENFSGGSNIEWNEAFNTYICRKNSQLYKFYFSNLPLFADIAQGSGISRMQYTKDMKEKYSLFCAQYFEGMLSDISTLLQLNSPVTGSSKLVDLLGGENPDDPLDLAQKMLICAAKIGKGSSQTCLVGK